MNILEMKEENLVNLTLKIVEEVEKLIPSTLKSSKNIYELLENNMGYSLTYIRDSFGATTGMGLNKYIMRRTYTLIVEKMDQERFNNLNQKEKMYNIHSFKIKCIKEFPFLSKNLDSSKMQPRMNKQLIHLSLKEQLEIKDTNSAMNSMFKAIIKDRELVDISKLRGNILIQDNDDIIVDIDKNYFKKGEIIFNITAKESVIFENSDVSSSLLLKDDHKYIKEYPINTNIAIRKLARFYSEEYRLTSLISLRIRWGGTKWGSAEIVSHIYYNENNICRIKLLGDGFITFEGGKVWLNTDSYTD